jgi:Tfp pilus assembly protein PilF
MAKNKSPRIEKMQQIFHQEGDLYRLTRLGIEAYRAGSRAQARRFFRQVLMENPEDISTWLWLVEVSETDAEKQRCLERVLKIDPQHIPAQGALAAIKARLQAPSLPHVSPFFQGEDPEDNLFS